MNHSIFSRCKPPPVAMPTPPTGDVVPTLPPARKPSWTVSSDIALIAILEAPLHPHETTAIGFARKEAELCHLIEKLTVLECRALRSRLESPKSGDQLAVAFQRLTGERRARIIHFIADARRREALRGR